MMPDTGCAPLNTCGLALITVKQPQYGHMARLSLRHMQQHCHYMLASYQHTTIVISTCASLAHLCATILHGLTVTLAKVRLL